MRLWIVALMALAVAAATPTMHHPLPLCPADIFCTDCAWDCVKDCLGVCGGPAIVDQCGVCDGDGSSCEPACDKECQTVLIAIGVVLAVLLLCLFLWFILAGPGTTFLVPATAPAARPLPPRRRLVSTRRSHPISAHVRRRKWVV